MRIRRAAARAAIGTAAACLSAPAALAGSVPAKDHFHARITTGHGRWHHAVGRFGIDLAPGPFNDAVRQLTIEFRGRGCTHKRLCIRPRGRLSGTMTAAPHAVPDVGRRYTIAASGRLTRLGNVTVTGTVAGTGFIAQGEETMTLTITNRSGSVTVDAHTGPVPGFSSP